ncbi:bifunctional nuclease family protein [Natronomonas sp. EA1]|uniref:bifunctional nuclease family protein n=1 Tax=Natronomonas sp. EA1 TaxID=3421655 RepID=UPI003EBBCDF1
MTHQARVRGLGVSVRGETSTPVVILDVREEVVPIFISHDQAQSIQQALEGTPFERPLTHDLFVDLLAEFGGAIDAVRIDGLADGTFLAKIDAVQYREGEPEVKTFDARPSDAIAIALRMDCPIEVASAVVDEAGRPASEFEMRTEDD